MPVVGTDPRGRTIFRTTMEVSRLITAARAWVLPTRIACHCFLIAFFHSIIFVFLIDELDDVEEQFTFPKNDYILSMKNGGKSDWIGVKNVNDPKSKDKWGEIVDVCFVIHTAFM